jgi:hypothetical protein
MGGYGPGTSLTDPTGSIPDTVSQWQTRVKKERMPCYGPDVSLTSSPLLSS